MSSAKHALASARLVRDTHKQRSQSIRAAVVVMALCASVIGEAVLPMATVYAYQYSTAVLADSPAAYWPADDGSGTSVVASAGGHNLTLGSSGMWDAVGMVAGSSYSLKGDGTNYASYTSALPGDAPSGGVGTSMEIWYSSTGGSADQFLALVTGCISGTCSGYDHIQAFGFNVSVGDGHVSGYSFYRGTERTVRCSMATQDGAVHMIDVTSRSGTMTVYADGVSCGSGTTETTSWGASGCRVGLGAKAGYCDGFEQGSRPISNLTHVGQLSMWSRELSATEVANHWQASGFFPGAVTNVVAKASINSASLTWTPPTYSGPTPIASYTITPIVDGLSSTPTTVIGQGGGANIPNLPGGASYTFQVQANNAKYTGVAVTSNAVTVGSPSAGTGSFGTYLMLRGGPGNGQAFSHYGFVSRNNVPALSNWTFEARLWGFNSFSNSGSHAAMGFLSGTTSNPSDQNPLAGLNFNIGGAPLQTSFVWPGSGSCAITSDSSGIASAFNGQTTTPVHVAESFDGATVRGFINGSQVCTQATTAAALAAGPFGFMDNAGINQAFFDEIRVSSVARYTANFTPPTQQFTTDGSTNILWRFNDYGISKLPSTHILSAQTVQGGGYAGGSIPSTYRDSSGNTNHANTIWASGPSSVSGNDDWRRPYSLGQGVTADELTGDGSPWLCPCTINSTALPVNDATGEFWHTFTDFRIPGRVALDFTRTYSSLRTATLGPTGYGWTDNYNQYLSFDGSGNATVHAGNGSAVVFTFTSPSSYTAPPSEHVTLVKNGDSTFTLTDTGQNQTVFNVAVANVSTVQKLVDRHGGAAYTLTLAYNGDGTLATVTEPAGRTLSFTYQTIGSNKLIQGITDTATPPRSVSFQYGTNPSDATTYLSLTQATDVGGGLTKFTYDSSHYLLTMTDPNNGVTTNTFDATTHRVTNQQDPMHRNTTFSYSGGITTVTDPKGNVTQEEYLNGMLVSRTQGYGTAQQAAWTYAYDVAALGVTAVVGPNGESSTSVRDSNANPLSSTDGMGRTTSRTFNTFSEPLTIKDPLGVTTTTTYTATGDLKTTSRPLLGSSQTATTTYSFGDSAHPGDVTGMADPDNKTWAYTYDSYGNRVSSTDPLLDKTTYAFDSVGRMTSMVTPKGNVTGGNPSQFTWTYTYDVFGNRTSVTDPLNGKTTYHYDPNQNLDAVTDADSNVTTNVYDLDNELTQVKRADSPQTNVTTDYNADGTVLDQKDGKGNPIMTYAYDSLARVTSVTDALNNVTTYTYDGNGNRLSKQDPGGNCSATPATGCTTFTYDASNELVAVTYSDGVTPNVSNISYDADGQRTGLSDGTGSSSWAWDSLHRMISYTNGNGAQVQWAYNLRNLPTTITYPGSLNAIRGYDSAGRLSSIQDWNSNTTTFGYDPNSNLTTETFPTASGVVDTSTFDNADRQTATTVTKVVPLFTANYTRDPANQLTADTSASAGTGSYKYTPLNQLCYAGAANLTACSSPPPGSTSYKYDAADNLIQSGSTQQAFNNADQVCWTASATGSCATPPSGATTYQFDTRGNRTGVTPASGQAQTLTYDQANRITKYVGGSTTTYAYNADGLRMSKTSGSTSQFVWDTAGASPLLLKDGSTAYVYGPSGLPLEQISGSNTYYFHNDQLGSTRLLTDSSGSVQSTYTYDAFGNLTATTGSIANPLRFAGQYVDLESGLYYLRARYYDPITAQFVTLDPAAAATRQSYAYVKQNPLNLTDPSGLNTSGLCASFGITVPGVHIGVSTCVVVDDHGNIGTSFSRSSGFGVGLSASGTSNLEGSNADTIYDLNGPFANAGGSVGPPGFGPVATVEGSRGSSCGRDVYVGALGLGVGIGFPFEVHFGGSNTYVNGVFGPGPRKHGCTQYGLSASATCQQHSNGVV
jgi:RHS repeat-associated protein